ncbi:MAG: hypothetical protein IJW53_02340 [Clostridia bacterium]|nr:hypothetical protein [Clostridia bacterium]
MKIRIRLTSFALIIAIMACCFSSCDLIFGKDPKETVDKAEAALEAAPYTVEMAVTYESSDQNIIDAIKCFTGPVIRLEADGDDLRVSMQMSLDGNVSKSVYTVCDGMIYLYSSEQTASGEKATREKIEYTSELREEITDMLGIGANIRYDDFKEAKERGSGGESIITCTGIKDEALYGVANLMQDKLSSLGAMVGVKDATLIITIEDGKYQATVFSCTYIITTPETVYTVSMSLAAKFDYTSDVSVSAPTDADDYVEKS